MAGLFDLIKATMLVAGGARKSRLEEEEQASQKSFREADIETRREGIRSQENIAREGRETQKEIHASTIDWEKEKQTTEQSFLRSENKFTRDHARELTDLKIKAEQAMASERNKTDVQIAQDRNQLNFQLALLDATLRREGFALEKSKMTQDMSVARMKVMVDAVSLAIKSTTGVEGLMTAASSGGEMGSILNAKQKDILRTTLRAMDPNNKMGLRDMNIDDYIVPLREGGRGATEAQGVLRGMGFQWPGLDNKTTQPAQIPRQTPSIPLRPGDIDNIVPTPAITRSSLGVNTFGIDPADQLALDRVAYEISSWPEEKRGEVLNEYSSYIQDPMSEFKPMGDPAGSLPYRQNMMRYLRKNLGLSFE